MKKILAFLLMWTCFTAFSQKPVISTEKPDQLLPVRGFCISAPLQSDLADFIKFIDEELGPRKINTLILRVDYNYHYESHPELRNESALSKKDVKKMEQFLGRALDSWDLSKEKWCRDDTGYLRGCFNDILKKLGSQLCHS